MKKKLRLLTVLLAVVLIPALLAPLVFSLFRHHFPFERVFSRLIMIFAFLGVLYLIGNDFSVLRRYGFVDRKDWHYWLLWGFFLGVATLLAVELFETFLGVYDLGIRVKWTRIPERLFKAFFTGLLIGTTEEFFFRGFVFLSLAKMMSRKQSFVITNLFYAFVHFFHGTQQVWISPNVVDSFRVLLNWFTLFVQGWDILPQFFGLFLFGCILNYAFMKSGALYLPIGIHSGAVFFLKADVMFFGSRGEPPVWLYGGKNFCAGIIGWIFLLGLFFALRLFFRNRSARLT